MRDPKRIKPFMEKIADIWEENCPDWRFGQLISNVFDNNIMVFFEEEDQILKRFENYFKKEDTDDYPLESIKDIKRIIIHKTGEEIDNGKNRNFKN
jgi:hypothetical protein